MGRDKQETENVRYCWDEFRDWCEDNGVSLDNKADWETWWDCWKTAIDTSLGAHDSRGL